ncbi:hypothetical protein ACFY3G_01835 [Streptomyces phaeochromogenes]|uniref:hypothetical protein n=1 Tax=Streptomyces phaeochromogenes TaxID=1923 RepID=UPI00367C2ADA
MPENPDPASKRSKKDSPPGSRSSENASTLGPEAERTAKRAAEKTLEQVTERATEQESAKAPWLELPLAWISYLRTEINRQECRDEEGKDCERKELIAGARKHLRIAEAACLEKRRWFKRRKKANRLERIWANVRAADVNLLALNSEDELRARCGHVKEMVQNYTQKESPQHIKAVEVLERIMEEPSRKRERPESPISEQDRFIVIQALGIAYLALDGKTGRVRILANVLWLATLFTFIGAAGIALWGIFDPQVLSLCFEHPKKGDLIPNMGDPETVIVCPTGEEVVAGDKRLSEDYVDRMDVLSVELAGLVGAALTTIASLRRIHDDHTSPYALPLAAATLKFPLGAIAAFVGIMFIRGAFLPGLSALDTPIQILAWAVLFGAAQHLVTHLIDEKAQTTLSSIGKPPDPPEKTPAQGC